MIFLVVAVLLITRFCVQGMADPDIWWHLRNAQFLLQNHALPRVDTYSFGAAGSAWMNHEWLSEIPFYLANVWGLQGLFGVSTLLVVLLFAGVYYRACRAGGNCRDAIIFTVFGLMLSRHALGPRPLLLGWLCMVALLLILDNFERFPRLVWLLPPLFALWINLHGSWVYGAIVLVITIVSGLFAGEWGQVTAQRWSPRQLKTLLIAGVVSVAALFINPFGYRLVLYPFDLLFRQTSNLQEVQEWLPVNFQSATGRWGMAMILILLVAAWFSRRRWSLGDVLLTAFALWSALSHVRLFFFAGLVLPPILVKHFSICPPYDRERDQRWLNAAIIAMLLVVLVYFYPPEALLQQKLARDFPVAALEFMQTEHIQGPIFNSYGFGGFMEWYAPELKPFIDGRADIFVYNGSFDDYVKIEKIEQPLELLQKYGVKYVLFNPNTPLAYVLDHSPAWRLKYSDSVARLYERVPGS
jgi:hypothetical protein